MPKPPKFYLVCLTEEALRSISTTHLREYITYMKYLACTEFVGDVPYCHLTATPNEQYESNPPQEFLIPNEYVSWVAVSEDKNVFGFANTPAPKDT